MPSFTLAEFKTLHKDIPKFIVNEGDTLAKPEKDYLQV